MSKINSKFPIKLNTKWRAYSQVSAYSKEYLPITNLSRKKTTKETVNDTSERKGKYDLSAIKNSIVQKYISAEFNKKQEVMKSDEYQNLLNMIQELREEKEQMILSLKEVKYEKELELKNMVKCKNRAKMEIWDCMGKISKAKDDIEEEEIKNKILHDYFENEDSSLQLSIMSQSNRSNEQTS